MSQVEQFVRSRRGRKVRCQPPLAPFQRVGMKAVAITLITSISELQPQSLRLRLLAKLFGPRASRLLCSHAPTCPAAKPDAPVRRRVDHESTHDSLPYLADKTDSKRERATDELPGGMHSCFGLLARLRASRPAQDLGLLLVAPLPGDHVAAVCLSRWSYGQLFPQGPSGVSVECCAWRFDP